MIKASEYSFAGMKVLVRVDFNVPLDEDLQVTDTTRIEAAIPTIEKILDDGGAVILMSHLGRPKNGPEERYSLSNILFDLGDLLNKRVDFANDCIGREAAVKVANLKMGQVLLLENLRFYPEEKSGEESFAKRLFNLGADCYVNDAFGTAHREHASVSTIVELFDDDKRVAGLLMEKEVENALKVYKEAEKPFTAIIGGAKVSDKMLLIENLLDIADNVLIGGGMAYTFFKAMGGDIGKSLCEEDRMELAQELMITAAEEGVQLLLPIDSVAADDFAADAKTQVVNSEEIPEDWMGLDIGPVAIETYSEVIKNSKTILWNGPLGVSEMEAFANGTMSIGKAVATATEAGAFSLVGGGDSVAALNQLGLKDKISYVSTGGGALLEMFEGKVLPGIDALE